MADTVEILKEREKVLEAIRDALEENGVKKAAEEKDPLLWPLINETARQAGGEAFDRAVAFFLKKDAP